MTQALATSNIKRVYNRVVEFLHDQVHNSINELLKISKPIVDAVLIEMVDLRIAQNKKNSDKFESYKPHYKYIVEKSIENKMKRLNANKKEKDYIIENYARFFDDLINFGIRGHERADYYTDKPIPIEYLGLSFTLQRKHYANDYYYFNYQKKYKFDISNVPDGYLNALGLKFKRYAINFIDADIGLKDEIFNAKRTQRVKKYGRNYFNQFNVKNPHRLREISEPYIYAEDIKGINLHDYNEENDDVIVRYQFIRWNTLTEPYRYLPFLRLTNPYFNVNERPYYFYYARSSSSIIRGNYNILKQMVGKQMAALELLEDERYLLGDTGASAYSFSGLFNPRTNKQLDEKGDIVPGIDNMNDLIFNSGLFAYDLGVFSIVINSVNHIEKPGDKLISFDSYFQATDAHIVNNYYIDSFNKSSPFDDLANSCVDSLVYSEIARKIIHTTKDIPVEFIDGILSGSVELTTSVIKFDMKTERWKETKGIEAMRLIPCMVPKIKCVGGKYEYVGEESKGRTINNIKNAAIYFGCVLRVMHRASNKTIFEFNPRENHECQIAPSSTNGVCFYIMVGDGHAYTIKDNLKCSVPKWIAPDTQKINNSSFIWGSNLSDMAIASEKFTTKSGDQAIGFCSEDELIEKINACYNDNVPFDFDKYYVHCNMETLKLRLVSMRILPSCNYADGQILRSLWIPSRVKLGSIMICAVDEYEYKSPETGLLMPLPIKSVLEMQNDFNAISDIYFCDENISTFNELSYRFIQSGRSHIIKSLHSDAGVTLESNDFDVIEIDIKRCHPTALLQNELIPILSAFDEPTIYDIKNADLSHVHNYVLYRYIVTDAADFAGILSLQSVGMDYGIVLIYLIKNGVKINIISKLSPSTYKIISGNPIKLLNGFYKKHNHEAGKSLINARLCGSLGIKVKKGSKSEIFTQYNDADFSDDNFVRSEFTVGDVTYYERSIFKTSIYKTNFVPIYTLITSRTKIEILKLFSKLKNTGNELLYCITDGITLKSTDSNLLDILNEPHAYFEGMQKYDLKRRILRPRYMNLKEQDDKLIFGEYMIDPSYNKTIYKMVTSEVNNISVDETSYFNNRDIYDASIMKYVNLGLKRSCVLSKYAGSGKSHITKQYNAASTLFVVPLNDLFDASIDCVTLHKFLAMSCAGKSHNVTSLAEHILNGDELRHKEIKHCKKVKTVVFDEIYLYTVQNLSKIFDFCTRAKNINIIFSGDVEQLQPVNQDIFSHIDAKEYYNRIIRTVLSENNIVYLQLVKRCDTLENSIKLSNMFDLIFKHGVDCVRHLPIKTISYNDAIPYFCKPNIHLCYTNARKDAINYTSINAEISNDGRAIIYDEHRRRRSIVKLDSMGATEENGNFIQIRKFYDGMRGHTAFTIHSAQGKTYDCNVYIHQTDFTHVTASWLYVALSRCKNPDNITIVK